MERFDVSDDPRMAALVEAAARGEEAAITRDGRIVAEVRVLPSATPLRSGRYDPEAIRRFWERTGYRDPDGTALIRELRDADEH